MIARCADVADVIAAVNFGRDNKLPIAIRGGGHNGPGLRQRRRRTGHRPVADERRAGRPGEADGAGRAPAASPATSTTPPTPSAWRCPFGIISTTGVAGLTLSGGHGYLSRQYGLAIDNLLEADVVLADGSFVTASETENADLFWALRGGGGNFGVVTSFLFRTHPASMVYGGPIIFELADAPRSCAGIATVPAEGAGGVLHVPRPADGSPGRSVPEGALGQEDVRAARLAQRADRGGREGRQRRPRGAAEADHRLGAADALPGAADAVRRALPKGLQWYWKGDFVKDAAGRGDRRAYRARGKAAERAFAECTSIRSTARSIGERSDATAWGYRDATWSMVIVGVDPDPAKAPVAEAMGAGTIGRRCTRSISPAPTRIS